MFCGVGEEERTKFRKKKKEKKEINLIAAKSGFVGMKGCLKMYNHVKYFLPYLCRFRLRPLFTPNFRGGFQVLKPKSRDQLPRNLVQTYNSIISNCCQNLIKLDGSLPANPVNDRRTANAVTFKSTFCLP